MGRIEVAGLLADVVNLARESYRDQNSLSSDSGQNRCLLTLEQSGAISQRRLSDILGIRATSLSETINRLEKKNLIIRRPSEEDKRTFIVDLSVKGHEEAVRLRREKAAQRTVWLDHLSEDELAELERILKKIVEGEKNEFA